MLKNKDTILLKAIDCTNNTRQGKKYAKYIHVYFVQINILKTFLSVHTVF